MLVDEITHGLQDREDRLAFLFLEDGERPGESLTGRELDARARAVGAELERRAGAGERTLLAYPPGLEFIVAFLGCLYAGVVAVPAYPPRGGRRGSERLRGILADCAPRAVLTVSSLADRLDGFEELGITGGTPVLATDRIDPAAGDGWEPRPGGAEELAFLQYTSGSTGKPKGVRVTRGNLEHNERLIQRAFEVDESSVIVGWLPLFHDMGLIGNVLQPLWAGARCVLMSPTAFLQRPLRWLAAVDRYRGTVSGGPDFAYALCARRLAGEDDLGLDLSSWRVAFDGSEPVRPETLGAFTRAFGRYGFRREALYPCYGLAEATLFVTGGRTGEAPVEATFDRTRLAAGEAVPPNTGRAVASRYAGSGRVDVSSRAEAEVAIVEPESRRRLPDGRVGEIWTRGPSVADGYWRRPRETAAVFGAAIAGEPEEGSGWLRTGDLGTIVAGELFVTGRSKDLVILRGRNLYPQDVERTVEAAAPGLRAGGAAAFSVEAEGEERLVAAVEVHRRARVDAAEVEAAVRQAVAEEHEARLHDLVLLRHGTLPKTTSGKVRRRTCRERYVAGTLERIDAGRGPSPSRPAPPAASGSLSPLESYLAAHLSELGLPAPDDPARPLTASGLDSLLAAELSARVEAELGAPLPLGALLGDRGLAGAAAALGEALRAARAGAPVRQEPDGAEVPEVGDHPASWQQRGIWFLERLSDGRGLYNVAAAARSVRPLDRDALERGLARLVARHGALRTLLVESDGPVSLIQRVVAEGEAALETVDARGWSEDDCRDDLVAASHRPFDLTRAPLLRVRLLRREDGDRLLLVAHHAVVDFLSLVVLVRELSALYGEETGGPAADLPPPGGTYAGYTRRQLRALTEDREAERVEGWRRHLGALPRLDLPTDCPRPVRRGWEGDTVVRRLPAATSEACRRLAAERGTTLYGLLLAGFATLLGRLAGQRELVVGSPAAGRAGAAEAGIVGLFADPLVLRLDLGPGPDGTPPSFDELLERVGRTVAEALDRPACPFALLATRLQGARDPGRSPLFDVMLVHDRVPETGAAGGFASGMEAFALRAAGGRLPFAAGALESLDLPQRRAPLDLTLAAGEVGGGLLLSLLYDSGLFDRSTGARWLGHLETLLEAAVDDPSRAADELPMMERSQRSQVVLEWSGAGRSAPATAPATLHGRFLAQARRTPDAVAVEGAGGCLTYAGLEAASARVARDLRRRGAEAESRVAVLAERRPELLVALLGVLRAGAAYVPVDPVYPEERRRLIVEDSGARETLVPSELRGLAGTAGGRQGAGGALPDVLPERLAYLIHTSGSTGKPKAVAVAHRGAAALLDWAGEAFDDEEVSAVLASTSACFDVSVLELFAPLARGGRVVIVRDLLALPETAAAERVTLLAAVPSPMAELIRLAPLPDSLRTVALAGEALPGELVRAIGRRSRVERVWNVYGPTEDTVYATAARLDPAAADRGREPSIGRPLDGKRSHVLDAALRPLPPGAAGELFLGGPGVARGYHGRAGLTAERFVPDPFPETGTGGGRLYRTGDRVRRRADGEIEFLGRFDDQVKVRGFRVEPGEVAAALGELPGVAEAVVVAARGTLHAYVVPAEGGPPVVPGELLERLAGRLPAHLVPATLTEVARMPRSASGKIDRAALPVPRSAAAAADDDPPSGETELALAALWCEVLDRPAVGRSQDFFAAGGHSLSAARLVSRMREALGVELPLSAVFEATTVAAQASLVAERVVAGADEGSRPVPLGLARAPLSSSQERLWLLSRMESGGSLLSVPFAVELTGPLDLPAFAAAWREVGRRQGALRTRLPEGPEGPVQEVVAPPIAPPPVVDLSGLPEAARHRGAQALAAAAARRRFDLANGPLARLHLLRLAADRHTADRHTALFACHHTIVDGWSLGVILGELAPLYEALRDGRPSPLPPLALQYTDYAAWERERLADGELLAAEVGHWRERLAGSSPTQLPADRSRRADSGFAGALARRRLAPGLAAAVDGWSRSAGTTPFVTLLTAFEALLARLTGERDLVVGTPLASRPLPELEPLVGCFLDTLALRTEVPPGASFRELAGAVRRATVDAFAHARVPFDRLVAELAPRRAAGRHPFFELLFVLQNAPLPPLVLPGGQAGGDVALTAEPLDHGGAQYELSLEVAERDGALTCVAEYRRGLFDAATVDALLERFERVLAGALDRPDAPLGELSLLADAERRQVLAEWSGAGRPGAPIDPVAALAAAAERHPDRVALVAGETSLSYGGLHRLVDRAARCLAARGAGPETRVGVYLERSPEAIVTLLGVLRAGAAYLPLDPEIPVRRLRLLLEDARPGLVVSDGPGLGETLEALREAGGAAIERLDRAELLAPLGDDPVALPDPVLDDSAAYVIYTSGTTGRPKGVVVGRRSLAGFVGSAGRAFGLGDGDRLLQFHSLSFDASVEEIFCTLAHGAALVLRDDAMLGSVDALLRRAERHRITVLDLPTAYWHRLAAALDEEGLALPPAVRLAVIGGEQARPDRLAAWRRRAGAAVRLVNSYGPTEATVTVTQCVVSAGDGDEVAEDAGWRGAVGRPLAGSALYVLDARMRPVAPGAAGQLWIGGEAVSRGYLSRPAATAERFRPDPFGGPGGRLYASGDRARFDRAGTLWYLGRVDRQVKVRGFRVEPGEVEAALERLDPVAEAVVAVRKDSTGDPRLLAWVRPREGAGPSVAELRDALARELPAYMLPSAVVRLDELPRLPSGKVDRRSLPEPGPGDLAAPDGGGEAGAATPAEELVAQVWAEVLGLPADRRPGPDADFFELGGHSIVATRALSRLRTLFGVELPLRSLFEAPTVRGVARLLERAERPREEVPGLVRLPPEAPRRLSYSQERLWFLDRVQRTAAYNLSGGWRLRGPLSPARLAAAVGAVARRHEVLRSRFVRVDGEPVQRVLPAGPGTLPRLPVVDLSRLPEPVRHAEAARWAAAEAGRLFDLARGPLLRTVLLRHAAGEHDLLVSLHHTVGDGWSVTLFRRDIAAFYSERTESLPPLPLQYGDWAEWQRRWLEAGEMERQLDFWRRGLTGLPTLRLPTDRPRPDTPTHRGALVRFTLPLAIRDGVDRLARRLGATPFMVLLAAFDLFLARWCAEEDVVVGTDVAGRTRRETEPLIGFFVNALVLRTDVSGNPTFEELVRRVRETVLDASAHQDVPFHRVVEAVNPRRLPGANPLFQVKFSMESTPRVEIDLDGLAVEPLPWETASSIFDLSLTLEDEGDGFGGTLRYSTDLFETATAEAIVRGYGDLVAEVVDRRLHDPGVLADLPVPLAAPEDGRPPRHEIGSRRESVRRHLEVSEDRVSATTSALGASGEAVLLAAWRTVVARVTGDPAGRTGVWVDGRGYLPIWAVAESAEAFAFDGEAPFADAVAACGEALGRMAEAWERFAPPALPAEGDAPARPDRFAVAFRHVDPGSHGAGDPREPVGVELGVEAGGGRLAATLAHDPRLLDRSAAERLLHAFEVLLAAALAEPGGRLADLPLLDAEAERRELAAGVAAPPPAGPATLGGPTFPARFAARAAERPDDEALVDADGAISFREVEERSRRLAARLRERGAGPEVPIALVGHRDAATLLGLVAIARSGATLLPLDPTHPEGRIAAILETAAPAAVLSSGGPGSESEGAASADDPLRRGAEAAGVPWLDLAETLASAGAAGDADLPPVDPETSAYWIFTSGSTGRPKGTRVSHRSLAHLDDALQAAVLGPIEAARGEPIRRVAVNAPLVFDAAVKQWLQLARGRALVAFGEPVRLEPRRFVAELAARRVDLLDVTPSHLAVLLDAGLERAERPAAVLVGGEAIEPALWRRLAEDRGRRYVNVYGPTECTVDVTAAPVEGGALPDLGAPLPAVRLYLLDRHGRAVVRGAPGELHVGGPGVARGYAGSPGATAARFVPDPFGDEPGGRLFATGDLARRRSDGTLGFLGRRDRQVKLRGLRLEPGEIEAVLAAHPAVRRAAVDSDGEHLVAWAAVGAEAAADADRLRAALRDHLRGRLPEFMVPARLEILAELPRTVRGKVDRAALAARRASRPPSRGPRLAPRNETESRLAAIWCRVLGVDEVGVEDNFFDLGGHSLLMVRLHDEVRRSFDQELPMLELFRRPTVAALAAALDEPGGGPATVDAGRIQDRARRQAAAAAAARRRREAARTEEAR